MIAEGIIFDIPFDMSSYSKEDILERFTPYKDTSQWGREMLDFVSDNVPIHAEMDTIKTDDMVIRRFKPEITSTLVNLYLTTGIFDMACPKLSRIDLLEDGSFLVSYPYFPENPEYSKKIKWAIEELERVSLFILDLVGKTNLTEWKKRVIEYAQTYFSFVDRDTLDNLGNKKLVKRIYKRIIDL